MNKVQNICLNLVITLLLGVIIYFFWLPPINPMSLQFWMFLIFLIGTYIFVDITTSATRPKWMMKKNKTLDILAIIIVVIIGGVMLTNIILSPVFQSKGFSKRIEVDETSEFVKDIPLVDFEALPLLDKDSSSRLGDRVMGQMPELVSQFLVSDIYTQINYKNEIVRVTPLEYNGFFKYLSNHKEGIKGYITVNSVNGKAELVKLKKGMKYMPSAILFEDLDRHLRFKYPTKIFGEKNFEIDNEGNPYWTVPTLKYTGVELREEVEGLVILNPVTGESKYYKVEDVPKWVDHVYNPYLIMEQVDDWGQYKNGFLNSIFGQKNVVATTTGYNYTILNDDVYLYTGITSVSSDQSNLGFILSNLRTKETKFYPAPGAEEESARASAEGQVQQMRYKSTFPLLINLNNRPTYLISLKDNAGLVKMYAFVDVSDYQKVVVTDASKGIEAAAQNYLGNTSIDVDNDKLKTKTITIDSIATAVINGTTHYFITDTKKQKYNAPITVSKEKLPFLTKGSKIEIGYQKENTLIEIVKIN